MPWLQLALIAVGHVVAVVLLHELALERLSPRAAMRTTWAMAVVGQRVDHRGLPAGAHVTDAGTLGS